MDEFGLIARYFAPLAARDPGALSLSDDAAVLDLPLGARLVAATDALVAGVHFLPDDPPGDIARKMMRVNLSDIAAMGAVPRAVLLAAILPRGTGEDWIAAFAAALGEDTATFGAPLVGGDTVATDGPLTLSLTALGVADARGVLTRAGAGAGDDIYVSGTIGDGALGLKVLQGDIPGLADDLAAALIARYRVPSPRLALGQALVGVASACMDVSDGLIGDLGHICECSGHGARLTAAALPLSRAARRALGRDPQLMASVLTGGDDYELLFTAEPARRETLAAAAAAAGTPVTRIGVMCDAPGGVEVSDAEILRIDLKNAGFRHF